MAKSPLFLVVIALIVVQAGFGAYGVILKKYATDTHFCKEGESQICDSLIFSFLRDMCASPVLFLAAWIKEGVHFPRLRELPLFFTLGLFGMFGNQFLYLLGLMFTTADLASAAQPLIPVFTTIFAMATQMEKLPDCSREGLLKVFGILMSVGGAIMIVLTKQGGGGDAAKNYLVGYLCLGGNCMSMATYILLQKRYFFTPDDTNDQSHARLLDQTSEEFQEQFRNDGMPPLSPLNTEMYTVKRGCICDCFFGSLDVSYWTNYPITVTALCYINGAFCMGVPSVYFLSKGAVDQFPKDMIFPVCYAVFVSSSLCYGLITWCNKMVSSSIVTGFFPLQVFFAVTLAYFVLGTQLAPLQIVGALGVIVGLLSVTYSSHLGATKAASLLI